MSDLVDFIANLLSIYLETATTADINYLIETSDAVSAVAGQGKIYRYYTDVLGAAFIVYQSDPSNDDSYNALIQAGENFLTYSGVDIDVLMTIYPIFVAQYITDSSVIDELTQLGYDYVDSL